jgi:hypothetical protein
MERDIARARRRGCGNRAETLEASILVHKALSRRMAAERERETIRTLVPEEKETVLQGRVSEFGGGKSGLRVDIVSVDGKSIAHGTTDKTGAFAVRGVTGDVKGAKVVVSDGKGKVIRSDSLPSIPGGKAGYVEVAIDGLKPQEPSRPPDEPDIGRGIEVPNVVGLPIKDATEKIRSAGLKPTTEEVPDERSEPGTVIGQKPGSGALVDPASEVMLAVAIASGPRMPDLSGATLKAVPNRLKETGLDVGSVSLKRDPDNAGKVIGQSPAADTPVRPGTAVVVLVATGEPKADMNTAAILVAGDPRAGDLKLTETSVKKSLKDADVNDVRSLKAFARRSAGDIAKSLGVQDSNLVARSQALIVEIAARFPEE